MDNLNYGIIGNCTSAALVSESGSIDWLCLPRFDSPTVFAKLLDSSKGGAMRIEVVGCVGINQQYIPRTNLLCTTFYSPDGLLEVVDFMPRYKPHGTDFYCPPDVIRYLRVVDGKPRVKIFFDPKLEYGKSDTIIEDKGPFICAYTNSPYDSFYLYSDLPHSSILNHEEMVLDDDHFLLMSYHQKLYKQDLTRTQLKMERTKVYWLTWCDVTVTYPQYNDLIQRSALTLKLLSYQKTGAVIAALTTSLPETIGEERNWDYRYCWIRDGSMVVRILTELGHNNVANRYMHYIINMLPDKDEAMQIMYGISGEKTLEEFTLDHLEGYEGSKPVRVGNAAYMQKQNDIYGILMDSIHYYFKKFSTSLSYSEELWTVVRLVVRIVRDNWHSMDRGIWELRNESKHFTFSKVLCWVAVDRARGIAEFLHQPHLAEEWKKLENEIRDDIEAHAWSEKKQAYTQAYGCEELDASVLLMLKYGYVCPGSERFRKTVFAIQKELEHDGLMYRYRNKDDFGTPKSAFTICSFWLASALYDIGEVDAAKERFERLLSYSNHLGLFSEDLDFKTKRQLGNFPQAYSHLAIIEMAIAMSEGESTPETIIRKCLSND
ncbi:MAG TPA: glycoside hydrolase family 15 protein [Bacteroidaceae bacterium]|nr:glycoside hydrolase family 15 protein [Bacteroidaceae bacterium]